MWTVLESTRFPRQHCCSFRAPLSSSTAPGDLRLDKASSPVGKSYAGSSPNGVIARDFIHEALGGESGYFLKQEVIAAPSQEGRALNFNRMIGDYEYRWCLKTMYATSGSCWLTPSEIFAPWYGRYKPMSRQKLVEKGDLFMCTNILSLLRNSSCTRRGDLPSLSAACDFCFHCVAAERRGNSSLHTSVRHA